MSEIPSIEQAREALLEEDRNLKREFKLTPSEQKGEFVQNNTERFIALVAKRRELSLPLVLKKLSPEDTELQNRIRERFKPIIETVFEDYGKYTLLTPEQIRQRAYFLPNHLFFEYAELIRYPKLAARMIADLADYDGSGIAIYRAGLFKGVLGEGVFPEQRKYELTHSTIHTLQKTPPCPLGLIEVSADYFATKIMPDIERIKYPQGLFRKMTRFIGEESMEELIFGKSTLGEVASKLEGKEQEWFLKQCSRLNVVALSISLGEIPPPKLTIEALFENLLSRQ